MFNHSEEIFVPVLADTSEINGQIPAVSFLRDENYWRNQIAVSEQIQTTADITLESLLDPPISSRNNRVTSALDSNRDGKR